MKFAAKANENRRVRDAGMLSQPLWKNGPSVRVHFEFLALTEVNELKGFAKRRARGLAADDTFNLFDQTRAASFNRCAIEMRVAMDFVSTFLGEDCAKRRGDGNPPSWIDLTVEA